jgi:predicted nucleic acid-binding protein
VNGYLLDTNVVSAFAPARPEPSTEFRQWLEAHSDELFLSVVSIVEIEAGVRKIRRKGNRKRAEQLAAWLDDVLENYGDHVLPLDVAAGRLAGAITDRVRAAGKSPGFSDIAIAAIAAQRDLVVLTANARHFGATGVPHVNPFEKLPG